MRNELLLWTSAFLAVFMIGGLFLWPHLRDISAGADHPAVVDDMADQAPGVHTRTDVVTMIVISSHKYFVPAQDGQNVLSVMQTEATSADGFSFTTKYQPGYGTVVDSINGLREGSSTHWNFYVNGTRSQISVDNARVFIGDTVEWKLE